MSVDVAWSGELCIVSTDGRVASRDVTVVSRELADKARQLGKKLVVLAIVNGRLRMPTPKAKGEMRAQRETLANACAEVHVVLQRAGLLGELGLLVGQAIRLLGGSSSMVHFHRNEAHAWRALRERGVAAVTPVH